MKEEANQIIRNHAWFAAVPGFIPVFILDTISITAIQLDMIKKLCRLYEKDYSEEKGKSITIALSSTLTGRLPGYMLRRSLKAIPGIGWVLGGLTMSALASASTYATGAVFREHFSKGGTLENLDADSFKKFYKEEFKKAQKFAKEATEEIKEEVEDIAEDIQDKIDDVKKKSSKKSKKDSTDEES
ncbi:MAG: DUF697 domain-containing protein [Bacteroidota bacterium]